MVRSQMHPQVRAIDMEHVILAICGALWRWWDGRGKEVWPHVSYTLVRLSLLVPATLYAGYLVTNGYWSLWIAAWMVLNLHLSPYKFIGDWRSPLMAFRYSGVALITVAPGLIGYFPLYIDGMPYVAACAMAGLSYPLLGGVLVGRYPASRVREYGAEILVGAAVVGTLL